MGLIVPPRDPEALAGAVEEIVRNRAQYVRTRDCIEEHFSTSATVAGYVDLFRETLQDYRRTRA
jgi:glycosyltransferase involved in cell wall biosynthesis